jgi:hypothetical protein
MKLSIFQKSIEIFQVLLNSDKNNAYITWRGVNIYDILLRSCLNEEKLQKKFTE